MTEPISACLVNGICDFIQHARTVSFARDSYHIFAKQLLRNVIREIFTIFSPQIRPSCDRPTQKGQKYSFVSLRVSPKTAMVMGIKLYVPFI